MLLDFSKLLLNILNISKYSINIHLFTESGMCFKLFHSHLNNKLKNCLGSEEVKEIIKKEVNLQNFLLAIAF